MIGRRLGHFEITGSIGAGGMGVVYKATDLRLQRTVALKLLPSEVASDRDRRSRFEREARAASALNHPNIVTVHEIDSADGVDPSASLLGRVSDGTTGPPPWAGRAPEEAYLSTYSKKRWSFVTSTGFPSTSTWK